MARHVVTGSFFATHQFATTPRMCFFSTPGAHRATQVRSNRGRIAAVRRAFRRCSLHRMTRVRTSDGPGHGDVDGIDQFDPQAVVHARWRRARTGTGLFPEGLEQPGLDAAGVRPTRTLSVEERFKVVGRSTEFNGTPGRRLVLVPCNRPADIPSRSSRAARAGGRFHGTDTGSNETAIRVRRAAHACAATHPR
jgi:hypothetical protein